MYRPNAIKSKLLAGEVVVGCWSHLASPIATEIIALAGYDFVVIDHEHGPGHYLDAVSILQAIATTNAAGIIRVPWNDAVHVKRALDIGVEGIIVPYVSTAQEAKVAIRACMYPPNGNRGMAHVLSRASDYGLKADEYARRVDENLLRICMIETEESINNLPEIVKTEGLDMVFIGPFDLSCSIGCPGQFDDENFRALVGRAETIVRDSGKFLGSIGFDDHVDMRQRGYQFIISTSDLVLLRDSAVDDLSNKKFNQ